MENKMKNKALFFALCLSIVCLQSLGNPRKILLLDEGWKFIQKDVKDAAMPQFNDAEWENVTVPHDWAINKPFDLNIDWQVVQVKSPSSIAAVTRSFAFRGSSASRIS